MHYKHYHFGQHYISMIIINYIALLFSSDFVLHLPRLFLSLNYCYYYHYLFLGQSIGLRMEFYDWLVIKFHRWVAPDPGTLSFGLSILYSFQVRSIIENGSTILIFGRLVYTGFLIVQLLLLLLIFRCHYLYFSFIIPYH